MHHIVVRFTKIYWETRAITICWTLWGPPQIAERVPRGLIHCYTNANPIVVHVDTKHKQNCFQAKFSCNQLLNSYAHFHALVLTLVPRSFYDLKFYLK